MLPHEDETRLRDMVDHANRAIKAVRGRDRDDLDHDEVLTAALERFVEIVGEAANRLSGEIKERIPDVPWRGIIAMRNRLVHGYSAVDHDILWNVVNNDLPNLISELKRILESHD